MNHDELLDIVNKQGEVVGQVPITEVHEKALRHRIVNVWFYDVRGRVLLQQRLRSKETGHRYLDYTVGGHLSAGQTYEQALFQEMKEESGIVADLKDYHELGMFVPTGNEEVPDIAMHVRKLYAYKFDGEIKDLQFDPLELEGFEWRDIDVLIEEIGSLPKNFVPVLSRPESLETLRQIKNLSRTA